MKSLNALCALLFAMALPAQDVTRVACVGDSITYGSGVQGRESNSYPAVLQQLLGEKFEVKNFGVSGATLLKKGDKPYWNEKAFRDTANFKPEIVVIKLGTNDSKPQNRTNLTDFAGDLVAMVEQLTALGSKPRIYLCLPAPVYKTQWGINEKTVSGEIIPSIKAVAAKKKLPVIDLHAALANHPELFPDGVHPNAAGTRLMAETIYSSIR